MKNADMPAMPTTFFYDDEGVLRTAFEFSRFESGLTKREQACITLGVPETGDEELDSLIRKAERKRVAAMAMQGLLSNLPPKDHTSIDGVLVRTAVLYADDLLEELEK